MNGWTRWLTRRPRTASEWFARMQSDLPKERDDRELSQWLAKSPRNERDFQMAAIAWQLSAEFTGDPRVDRLSANASRKHRSSYLLAGAICSTLLVAVALYALQLIRFQRSYASGIGEHQTVVLPDGSKMLLNTASAARVQYGVLSRRVELVSGEATFDVTKDRLRPFEVRTGLGIAKAVGTEFDVFVRPRTIEVTVVAGTVLVQGSTRGTSTYLHPGEEATVDASARITVRSADLQRILTQQPERLDFDDATVADALAEFNQYSDRRIIAATPELSRRRISGVFHVTDTTAFVNSLTTSLRLEAHEVGEDIVLSTGPRAIPR